MATLTTTNLIHHQQTHDHFGRRNMDSSIESSIDSNDAASNYDRESLNIDNNSCSSDDTVLSVGNENPVVVDIDDNNVQNETLSFKNIESHLNAISKITNSTLDPDLKSPSSPLNQRLTNNSPLSVKSTTDSLGFYGEKSNPGSPALSFRQNSPISPGRLYTSGSESSESTNRSPKPQQDTNNHFYYQQNGTKSTNNNEPTGNLKFSIDNILKADFGRRITEPINIRKTKPKKNAPTNIDINNKVNASEETKPTSGSNGGGPVDLSKNDDKNGGKTSASATTENSSNQPMLWPAWVYCTRYSDRPSSGKFQTNIIYKSFIIQII